MVLGANTCFDVANLAFGVYATSTMDLPNPLAAGELSLLGSSSIQGG